MSKYGVISNPYFPAFGLNTERYEASLRIQSECGKMRKRTTPNTDTFYAVQIAKVMRKSLKKRKSLKMRKVPINFRLEAI